VSNISNPHILYTSHKNNIRCAIAGTTKAARRKAREEQDARSLVARVGRQGEIRVVNPGRANPAASREGDDRACMGASKHLMR